MSLKENEILMPLHGQTAMKMLNRMSNDKAQMSNQARLPLLGTSGQARATRPPRVAKHCGQVKPKAQMRK
jgi:hypothetical protein